MKAIVLVVVILCSIFSTLAVAPAASRSLVTTTPKNVQPTGKTTTAPPLPSNVKTGFEAPELAALLTKEESAELKQIKNLSLTRIFEIFQHMMSTLREKKPNIDKYNDIRYDIGATFLDTRLESTNEMDGSFLDVWFAYGLLPLSIYNRSAESRDIVNKFKLKAAIGIPHTLSDPEYHEILRAINNIKSYAPL